MTGGVAVASLCVVWRNQEENELVGTKTASTARASAKNCNPSSHANKAQRRFIVFGFHRKPAVASVIISKGLHTHGHLSY